jgi:hypothetical protein
VAERDRPLRRAKHRRARGIEPFEHLGRGQLGQQLAHRLVELQLALLDQLHAGGRGHRLGHRSDPEDGIRSHVRALGDVPLAEGAFVHDPLVGRCDGDDARHGPGVHRLAKRLVDRRHGATGQHGFLGRRAPAAGAGHGRYGHECGCRLEKVAATLVRADHWFLPPVATLGFGLSAGAVS